MTAAVSETGVELRFLLERLVRVPTINPPGTRYDEIVDILKAELESLNLEVQVVRSRGGAPSLLGWYRRGCKPELHFNGHFDVVPAGPGWTRPPFEPEVVGDRMIGLGTADMKAGIAAIIGALRSVVTGANRVRGSVSVSFVPDEETGGKEGAESVIKSGLISPDMVIIPEPTFPRILTSHKGVLQAYVITAGRASHAAMPFAGDNAFHQAVRIAGGLLDRFPIDTSRGHDPVGYRDATTVSLGGIAHSGNAVNALPAEARFSVDARFVAPMTYGEMLEAFERVGAEAGSNFRVETILAAEPWIAPNGTRNQLLIPLNACIEEEFNMPAPETMSFGFMDTRHFSARWDIPCLAYGPGESGTAHTPDESVSLLTTERVSRVFARVIDRLCC